jgi:hypothetical protein
MISIRSYRAIDLTLGKFDIAIGFTSLQPWKHFKVHCHPDIKWYRQPNSDWKRLIVGIKDGYFHLVWGKLSIVFENATLERYATCGECGGTEIGERSISDDESLTVCPDCRTVEGSYKYLNKRDYERVS